jgi:hypothetical protein
MNYPVTLFKGGESREVNNSGEEANARAQGFCEPYKFQEYPKALYRNGERVEVTWDSVEKLADGGCRIVKSKAEEEAARAEGFRMLHEPAPEVAEEPKAQPKMKKAA